MRVRVTMDYGISVKLSNGLTKTLINSKEIRLDSEAEMEFFFFLNFLFFPKQQLGLLSRARE